MNRTELLPDRPGVPPMAKLPDPETIDPAALRQAWADGDIDLVCVLGPTASGKTRYAVQLAKPPWRSISTCRSAPSNARA